MSSSRGASPTGAGPRHDADASRGSFFRVYEIQDQRFDCLHEIKEELTRRWRQYRDQSWQWRAEAEKEISHLREEDREAGDVLAALLMKELEVSQPENFELHYPVSLGKEIIKITGASETFEKEDRDYSSEPETKHMALFANAASLPNFDLSSCQSSISLGEALWQRLWISWLPPSSTGSDSAFCVTCPCPRMVCLRQALERPSASTDSYSLPRHFHENPFHARRALSHFEIAHGEKLLVREMLQRYAMVGELDELPDTLAITLSCLLTC